MLSILLFALLGFVFGYALPDPWGIALAVALPVVVGLATLVTGGASAFAWGAWVLTLVVVALAALGGRAVRARFGEPSGGRAASAR